MRAHDAERRPAPRAPASAPAAGHRAGPSGVLALQSAAGNRATTQMLHRFALEGPWNKGNPVHEVITIMALKEARKRLAGRGAKAGDLLGGLNVDRLPGWGDRWSHNLFPELLPWSAQQFVRGVVWADDPKGYLFKDDASTMNYSSGAMWWEEFDADEKDEPEELIARSHYGDLQFFHGMASADGETAAQTKGKMLDWARFLVGVAKGEIAADTKLRDHPLTARLFSAFPDWTIKRLFVYARGSDLAIRQRALGTLFHMIQDSYAHGHVARDASGAITQFHSYENQDHGEHGHYDAWGKGSTLAERFRNTHGAVDALWMCAEAAERIDQGQSTATIVAWLDEVVFKLSATPQVAGPGAEFAKH